MRIATLEDFSTIKTMALSFLEYTKYKEHSDLDTLELRIYNLLSSPKDKGIIIISDDGFLAGQSVPFTFGKGNIATEIAWWINPEARGKGVGKELIQNFEYWAKNIAGCFAITMVSIDDTVGSLYEKNGYKLYERAYMKVF